MIRRPDDVLDSSSNDEPPDSMAGLTRLIWPLLSLARRAGQWPPGAATDAGRANLGDVALMPAIAIGVVAVASGAMILTLKYGFPAVPTIVLALFIAVLIVWLSRGVTAKNFEECWPESVSSIWEIEG
jgi:hypothetical protein